MDTNHYPTLMSSLAGLASVARERAAVARTRRRPGTFVPPVARADAVAPIGDRGDDARRRDKRAETPDVTNFEA